MVTELGTVEVIYDANTESFRKGSQEVVEIAEQTAEGAERAGENIGDSFSDASKQSSKAFEEFRDKASDSIATIIDKTSGLGDELSLIGSVVKSISFTGLTAGLAAATTGLVKMAKAGIQDTSALENTQIQMIGLTDSVEKGNRAMAMAVKYYKNNPFNRFDVTSATKNLIQFGTELKDIPETLDKLGKVSLSTGAKIDTLAYYYQRTMADGRIATRDLLQMQNQGIPIFGALAKQMGITTGQVREFAAKGKIAIEDFQQAFDNLVSDEAMERFQKTLSRQMDRFKGRLSDMRGAIAGYMTDELGGLVIDENGLYRAYTKLLQKIADVMTSTGDSANPVGVKLAEGFKKVGEVIGRVIDKITALVEPALDLFSKFLNVVGDNAILLIPILLKLGGALTTIGRHLPVIGGLVGSVGDRFELLTFGLKRFIKLHPALSAIIGLFGVGLAEALKNNEQFKKTIQELSNALTELVDALSGIFKETFSLLVEGIKALANSSVIQSVLLGIASALSGIAKAIASIPPDNLAMLMSFFVSLKLLKTNPILLFSSAIVLLIGYIKKLWDNTKNLPENLLAIGHNMMTGLWNGLIEGGRKIASWVKNFATGIINTFKSIFKIHSPSQEMYEIGENITLGLAEGISSNASVVETAMNNLATDILKLSEKVISNKVDFKLLNVQQEYQEWKKVSKLFTEGSEQYAQAIDKMEDVRKKANLQILELQRDYNKALDATIDKIASMYGLLDEVDLGGGKNATTILKNLDQQVAKLSEWSTSQAIIKNLDLDEGLKEELQNMGVNAASELGAIANMTADELATLNDLWLKKQSIANETGISQMEKLKNETLSEIKEIKDGIDGETVDIADVGGRLVESISEGVYGAMPTLQSAFSQLEDYIAKAKKSLGETTSEGVGATDVEDELPDATTELKDLLEASTEKLKDMVPKILLGIIGAWGVSKIAPKILKALFNKIGQGLLSSGSLGAQNVAGSLFKSADLGYGLRKGLLEAIDNIPREDYTVSGKILNKIQDWLTPKESGAIQEVAKNASSVSKPAKTIAENSTQISQSVQTTGESFSKASSWMNSIKQGAQTIIWIAGAIAAVAGALWITYNALKDVDFLKLAEDLVAMGVAVAEFGALAWAADKLDVSVKGILVIAGLAGDIALVALACRASYELMKDIDWDTYAKVLGRMFETVAIIGILVTAAGAIVDLMGGSIGFGLLVIAGIAADTVVVALACRIAYELMKTIDWAGFGSMLGMMASAIGMFGLFAGVLGIPIVSAAEALGLLVIAGIALDMVVLAESCRMAYDEMKGMNWEEWGNMLGAMINALGIMGGISSVLGLFIGLETLGWISVQLVCDELIKTAQAIKVVDDTVPADFGDVVKKIENIKYTLEKISAIDFGVLIGSLVMSWSVDPLTRLMDMYTRVAEELARISELKIDEDVVAYNLDQVQLALEKVRSKTDAISGFLQAWSDEANANSVESAGRIIIVYGEVVDALNKLTDLEIKGSTYTAIDSVAQIVRYVKDSASGMFGWFSNIGGFASDVGFIKDIIQHFIDIIPTVQQISEPEYDVTAIEQNALDNIKSVEKIVYQLGESGTAGYIEAKEKDLGAIQSIINKFTEIIPVAYELSQSGVTGWEENALTQIKAVERIIYQIGECGTAGYIEAKEKDLGAIQSIINKFTELLPVVWQVANSGVGGKGGWKQQALDNINAVEDIIQTLGGVYSGYQVAGRADDLNYIQSIINKFTELVPVFYQLKDTGIKDNKDDVIRNVDAVKAIASALGDIDISQIGSLSDKVTTVDTGIDIAKKFIEFKDVLAQLDTTDYGDVVANTVTTLNTMISGVETGFTEKLGDINTLGVQISNALINGILSVKDGITAAGGELQSTFWWAINNRMSDEYYQGRAFGEQFRQGLYDIDYANAGWWAVQGFINGANNRAYGYEGVYHTGWWVANTFLQGLKDRGEQGSPWKTTMESGVWAIEGLLKGIQDSETAVVGEANNLADQIVEALSLEDISISPSLDTSFDAISASMDTDGGIRGSGNYVKIEQTNNNYTEYDIESVNRDLSWMMARV